MAYPNMCHDLVLEINLWIWTKLIDWGSNKFVLMEEKVQHQQLVP